MQYRNTETGAVVEVNCEVYGNWERIDAPSSEAPKPTKTAKKPTKKKGE